MTKERAIEYIDAAMCQGRYLPAGTYRTAGNIAKESINAWDNFLNELNTKVENSPMMNPVFSFTEILDIMQKYMPKYDET